MPTGRQEKGARKGVSQGTWNRVENGQNRVENGQNRVENGQNRVENGQNRVENGQNRVENGQNRVENGQNGVENGQNGVRNGENGVRNGRTESVLASKHWKRGSSEATPSFFSFPSVKNQSFFHTESQSH